MKANLSMACMLVALLLSLSGCTFTNFNLVNGSGKLAQKTIALSGITEVELTTIGELTIQMGDPESLVIEAEDNLLEFFETAVDGNIVIIKTRPNTSIRTNRPVKYTLTLKSVIDLATSSSGNITAPALQVNEMYLTVNSSGGITVAGLQASKVQASINSSGNIKIGPGQVVQQTINLSSSGNYQAGELQSESVQCSINSSGDATLWVTDRLTGSLSSSGNLKYYGNPQVDIKTSSSGRTQPLGNK